MSYFRRVFVRPLVALFRPLAARCRSYLLAPVNIRLDTLEALLRETAPRLSENTVAVPSQDAPSVPQFDINLLLHHSRSAFLRTMPAGANVLCSAGCSGNWYFEWVERCYGPVSQHIGLEYYTPKPDQLPPNVTWIANTVSNMAGVGDQSCDMVFSGQNLEHLWPEEVVGFLLESWRILRDQGHLIVDSPNRELTAPLNWSHPEHTVEITVPEAVKLFSLAGFDVEQTRGIWLCRDPRTLRILPFGPNATDDEWSLPERLITADAEPENSFIWWIEARRSSRPPDAVALRTEMSRIFATAWPERLQRFLVGCGTIEHSAGAEWVRCAPGQSGAVIYGPYCPLPAGRYSVTFDLAVDEPSSSAGDAVVARCDVMIGAKAEPIVYRDLRANEIKSSTQVTLEFELAQLEFGVQFRCLSFGNIEFVCRRGAALVEDPLVSDEGGGTGPNIAQGLSGQQREFNSLEEFDAFAADLNSRGDETERIPILSNSYLVDRTLLDMPSDPFSPEYLRAVLNVHARISGRPSYDSRTMEHTPLDVSAAIVRPAAYQNDGEWLGSYLESYGNLIRRLEVKPGMRVIEYGCGDAEISLHLARLGCSVTAIDIEPSYIDIVKEKAARFRLPISAICGDFMTGGDLGPFDRVFFYQAFHHSLEHQLVIENMHRILKPDGFIVFGPEPIVEPDGPWKHAVPYPWGPRLDGLSLRAMRTHGWMELGFQEPYFKKLLERNGWSYEKFHSTTNGLIFSITSKRLS